MKPSEFLRATLRVFALYLGFQVVMEVAFAGFAWINGSMEVELGWEWFIYSRVVSPVLKAVTAFLLFKFDLVLVRWILPDSEPLSLSMDSRTILSLALLAFGVVSLCSVLPTTVVDVFKYWQYQEIRLNGPISLSGATNAFSGGFVDPVVSLIYDFAQIAVYGAILWFALRIGNIDLQEYLGTKGSTEAAQKKEGSESSNVM